jgi:hypothetical protein
MEKDINNFITITRLKNGKKKITHSDTNKINIYKLLHKLGYSRTKLDNKPIYFFRNGTDIIAVTINDIKDVFINLLNNFEFTNLPDDIEYSEFYNCYYQNQPIKENGLFNSYLNDTLSDLEIHNYKLTTDYLYKQEFEVKELLANFEKWSFNKTVDTIGSFKKDSHLYYKNIGDNKYLIFTHNSSTVSFDSWFATFTDSKSIGIKNPISYKDIRLGFKLDRDFELIKQYLN